MSDISNAAGGAQAAAQAGVSNTVSIDTPAIGQLSPEVKNAFELVLSALQALTQRVTAAENAVVNVVNTVENFIPQSIESSLVSELQKLETFAKAEGSSVVGIIQQLANRTLGLFHSAPPPIAPAKTE